MFHLTNTLVVQPMLIAIGKAVVTNPRTNAR